MTLLTQTHHFYKDLEEAAREEAAARGLELAIVACEMGAAKQAAQLEVSWRSASPRSSPRRATRTPSDHTWHG